MVIRWTRRARWGYPEFGRLSFTIAAKNYLYAPRLNSIFLHQIIFRTFSTSGYISACISSAVSDYKPHCSRLTFQLIREECEARFLYSERDKAVLIKPTGHRHMVNN